MPEFVNPFTGRVPKGKLRDNELARAIRLDIAAEHEAVHLYRAHADATDNELARKVLLDIAGEEIVHIGEFQRLLSILEPDEEGLMAKGACEVDDMARIGSDDGDDACRDDGGRAEVPTVGSLMEREG